MGETCDLFDFTKASTRCLMANQTKPWNPSTPNCWEIFGEIVHQTFGSSVDDFLVDIEYKHQTCWCHPTFIQQQAKYPLGNGFHPFFKKFTYPFSTLFIHYPHFFFLFSLHLFLFCDEICYHLPCDLRPHGTWKINDHATPQHSQGLGAKYPPSFEWLV